MSGPACRYCDLGEVAYNFNTRKIQLVKHGANVKSIICSDCIQRRLMAKGGKKKGDKDAV